MKLYTIVKLFDQNIIYLIYYWSEIIKCLKKDTRGNFFVKNFRFEFKTLFIRDNVDNGPSLNI